MTNLFTPILNMSITASYIALAVILLRMFLKKLPKIFSYILWLPVWIRLVFPFSFNTRFSFLSVFKPRVQTNTGMLEYVPYDIGLMEKPTVDVGLNTINNLINSSLPPAAPASSVNPMQIIEAISSMTWVVGIVILLAYCLISYLKVLHNVKTATLVKDNIFETDRISTPFVCGFIKPKIYIPMGISENELSYILEHEQTHIKRFDYLVKPFAFFVVILHWFNPLIWLSFSLLGKDMEMSCDESVLRKMGNDIKRNYSNSLLSLSMKKSGLLMGSPLAFGESHIQSRIKNILTYKKPEFWVVVAAIIITAALMVAFTANPKNTQTPEPITSSGDVTVRTSAGEDIEKYLQIIISSPATASNPSDYIKAHQNEYENILKMGDEALDYFLNQFETNRIHNDLRGHIIMSLCKDLLGDRNNVTKENLLPQDWFSQLSLYEEIKLPDFKGNVSNPIEQLVYDAAVKQYARPDYGFTVVAPTIYGSYEEGHKLKVFVTVYSNRYKLYGKTLSEGGGGIVPAAITFTKHGDGSYTVDEYLEAMDGSDWLKSIKAYGVMPVSKKEIKGLYDKIVDDYGSHHNRSELLMKNLIEHLKANNQEDIILKRLTNEFIPLT